MKTFELGALVTWEGDPYIVIEWLPDIENYLLQHDTIPDYRTYVYASQVKPRKRANKYGAVKVQSEDGTFDSQAEYQRWCELKTLESEGMIQNLKRQQSFLLISPTAATDSRVKAVSYKVDFTYTEDGQTVAEEHKGYWTDAARLKAYLFMVKYPHIKYVVTGTQL